MKKGWLIGCGIAGLLSVGFCAGLGFLIYSGVSTIFALTQPVVDASQDFLVLLGQGKTAEAYASTANGYRAQQDEASFSAAVKQLGLTEYSSVSWYSRKITNQEGSAEGTVTSKSGATTPVTIQLVQEGGRWKVVGVRYGGVELATIKAPTPVPDEEELRRMTTEALLDINQAIKAKDFTTIYDKLSDSLKKETTPEQLAKSFQDFIDKNIDLGPIKNVAPQFEPPAAVNDKGLLVVTGHYPTQPSKVQFNLKYLRESGGWKLDGIHVNVGKD
jgi:hypothetical protein